LQSALESMVLMKNNGMLPLKEGIRKIAVVGCHADNARSFFGGYTHLSMVEAVHAAANSMAGVGAGGDTSDILMDRIPGTNLQTDETEEFHQVLKKLHPACRNLVEVLQAQLPEARIRHAAGYPKAGADTSGFEEALALVREADVVILTLGGKNGSGSVATMGEVVEHLYNRPCHGKIIIDDALKGAIDAYYEQYGVR